MSDDDARRWDAKWAAAEVGDGGPSPELVALLHGRAWPPGPVLDVAGGPGRNAVWLARAGHDVTLLDVSQVALDRATTRAKAAGVSLTTMRVDLTVDPVPPGPWTLIVVSHYLQRDLFATLAATLLAGGCLAFVQPTRDNLRRHAKPSARFLVAPGEAAQLVSAAGLSVEHAEEGWVGDGDDARHLARVLGRKP